MPRRQPARRNTRRPGPPRKPSRPTYFPKKRLGQHFLISQEVLDRIVEAANLGQESTVIEVGPGQGIVTRELVSRAGTVVAVEIDDDLCEKLDQEFAEHPNFHLVCADILKANPQQLLEVGHAGRPYTMVGNLPYYITAPILRHFLETPCSPARMVIMVQWEVAQNILAGPGDMSLLGVSVQFYAEPSLVVRVPPDAFYPPPEVQSAVISLDVRPSPAVPVHGDTEGFFKVVRAGFRAPRKQLHNSLPQGLWLEPGEPMDMLEEAGDRPNAARTDPEPTRVGTSLEGVSLTASRSTGLRLMESQSCLAPAKLNLTLELTGRRSDGYHSIESFVQTLDLCDRLTFEPADNISLEVAGDAALESESPDANLVIKAARLVASKTGSRQGVRVRLEKAIPSSAGLGGGSSDAATTLKALNALWKLGLGDHELVHLATLLGSDVPFFLSGNASVMRGRGEVIAPATPTTRTSLFLVLTAVERANKTGFAYANVVPTMFTDGSVTRRFQSLTEIGDDVGPDDCFNAFDTLIDVLYPEIMPSWQYCEELGLHPHLAGSGPTFYVWPGKSSINEGFVSEVTTRFSCRVIPVTTGR